MSRLNMWPWLRPFLILLLVISVPPLIYWFGYVQSSVKAARQQAYSTLSAVTVDFRARLEAHNQIASSAEKQTAELAEYLYSILRTRGNLAHTNSNARLELRRDSGGLLMNIPLKSCQEKAPKCVWQVHIGLENLVSWNVVETEFDGLLVLSDSNQLLAQDRRLPAQALGVPVPLRVGDELVDFDKLFKGQSLKPQGGKEATPDKGARPSLFDFGDDASVVLAGVEYTAFLQIVTVSVKTLDDPAAAGAVPGSAGKEPQRVRMLVCGLIAKDRLRRDAIELSLQTLIFVFSFVALGLCAIPFLKLRFIGAGERMRQRDVWLLGVSVLAATALLTMLVLNFNASLMLRDKFDAAVGQFADSVVGHLKKETNWAMEELRASVPALMSASSDGKAVERCSDEQPAIKPEDAVAATLASRPLQHYPDIEALTEMDLCGNQVRKWMARTIPTPFINNSTQPYFAPALALTEGSLAPGADGFAFTSSLTYTTGLLLGVYATPVNRRTQQFGVQVPAEERTGVATIGIPMRSVVAPVVARPFEYVLLDRSGVVVFQKTQGSFRGERFLEAVRGGEALTVAARSRDKNAQSYSYRGKSYRMVAVDVPDLRLTLITFYDDAVVESLAARIWGTAALFSLLIVASMLLGCAIAMMLFDGPFDWAWPRADRTGLYAIGIAVCLVAMLILVFARAVLDVVWLRLLMLATPGLVIVLLGSGRATRWVERFRDFMCRVVPALRTEPSNAAAVAAREESDRRLMPRVFIAFGVLALVAFIAWPVLVGFTDALDLRGASFQTGVANHWIAERARWKNANSSSVVNIGAGLDEVNCQKRSDPRCSVPEHIYASKGNYDRLLSRRADLALYKDCVSMTGEKCFADILPPVPFSITASLASLWASAGRGSAEEDMTLSLFAKSGDSGVRTPVLHDFTRRGVPGMILLLCSLVILVRSVARHVLGVAATKAGSLDEHKQLKECAGTNWLLLRPSRKTLDDLRNVNPAIDLRRTWPQKEFASPAGGSTLLIQHLEARLCDPDWRKPLRELLGSKHSGCVIVTSEIDPLYYLTQRAREKGEYLRSLPAGDKEEKEKRATVEKAWADLRNEMAEWAVALRDVRKIREDAPKFPPLEAGDSRSDLHAKLFEECTSDELIDIGTRLLARPELTADGWKDVVGLVLDAAEPYYRSTWELCSRQEKLVLIQLAEEGFVNPKQAEVVGRLARRGLVDLKPRYRIINESFKRFVRAAEPPERVADWERPSGKMSWSKVGTPLYALGAMIVAVLLFAEQEFFTKILAFATGGVATLGSLRNIYASMTGSAGAASKPA